VANRPLWYRFVEHQNGKGDTPSGLFTVIQKAASEWREQIERSHVIGRDNFSANFDQWTGPGILYQFIYTGTTSLYLIFAEQLYIIHTINYQIQREKCSSYNKVKP